MAEVKMSKAEYELTLQQLALAAQMLSGLDLIGFGQAINRADAAGAILDPTLYRVAAKPMEKVKEMAEEARKLVQAYREWNALVAEAQRVYRRPIREE